MTSFKLPSIRKLIRPDPKHILLDCDLSGADAQVVAWEADDRDLMSAFKKGLDVHNKNVADMWPGMKPTDKRPGSSKPIRAENKIAVHLTNYGGSARTMAISLGWKIKEAENFQQKWFHLHPGILDWHRRTMFDIQTKRMVKNQFGYRIVFFDRPDGLLPEALAWKPQSTVGLVCARGGVNLFKNVPWCQLLLQVHDSLVFQIPTHRFSPTNLEIIHRHLHNPVPYPEPLTIPWQIAVSSENWHKVQKVKWDLSDLPTTI